MILPSFATEVKNELARLTYEDSCCRTAELAALLRMGATITFGMHHTFGLNFTTENAAVARKVLQLLKSEGGSIRTEITVSRSRRLKKNNSYSVRVMPAPPVARCSNTSASSTTRASTWTRTWASCGNPVAAPRIFAALF